MHEASTSGSVGGTRSAALMLRSSATTGRPSTPSTRRPSQPEEGTTARPGLRLQYDANYYAAYVLDPDGNNIEGVCHKTP
jgi:hypothetical protein